MGGSPAAVVVASLVPASITLPDWLGGGGTVTTNSSYPFGDDATITADTKSSFALKVRVPGWATKATINGKPAPNGTLVTVACAAGTTTVKVALNPELHFEKGWGELAVAAGPAVEYAASGASVPSDPSNHTLFTAAGGATLMGSRTPGCTDIRTGSPGQNSSVTLNSQLVGEGHFITSVSLAFRYVAGYSPGKGQTKKASQVQVVLVDGTTSAELATVYTSEPLGEYSFDNFKGYSPPIEVNAKGLKVPNSKQVMVQLKFLNNQRNLQVQMAAKTGLNVTVGWSTEAAPGPHPKPSKFLRAPTDGLAVVRGPLVFALHPTEVVSVVKNYSDPELGMLPPRPMAVDYQIETSDDWNYAIDSSTPPKFVDTPSAGWTEKYPFGGNDGPSTADYPFSVQVQASLLPSWTFWQGSKITDNLPPSPVTCAPDGRAVGTGAEEQGEGKALACGAKKTLTLVPFGLTNIRIAVFPWTA